MSKPMNACPQCPWRLANQGKRHFGRFYTKQNLTRLWNQIRRGGRPQSCHLTDPNHPDHLAAGCVPTATPRECPGSVILVLREAEQMAALSECAAVIDSQGVDAYRAERSRGLSKNGIAYWLLLRIQFGGVPYFGDEPLPPVNVKDPEIGLPEYLKG